MTETQLAIAREIHRALKELGADAYALAALDSVRDFYRLGTAMNAPPALLAIIGGYGDTHDAEETLTSLQNWNAGRRTFRSFLDERH
jgi:hypothetical protein